MKKSRAQLQPAHIELATFASATMALLLCFGFKIVGVTDRLDGLLSGSFLPAGMKAPTLLLNPAVPWLGAAFLAILLPSVMLRVAGNWRRYLVWVLTAALTILWAPVLILSSHEPEIGVAVIAVLWSGFCAMVYAQNHKLPVEETEKSSEKPSDAKS